VLFKLRSLKHSIVANCGIAGVLMKGRVLISNPSYSREKHILTKRSPPSIPALTELEKHLSMMLPKLFHKTIADFRVAPYDNRQKLLRPEATGPVWP
jgi:hypothetical protein